MILRPAGWTGVFLGSALALSGCNLNRHAIPQPGVSQAIHVESGDRFYMDLEEGVPPGCRWAATCGDSDVSVRIVHAVGDCGQAKVEIRIHRGYDGPSTVRFDYKRPGAKSPLKGFTLALFKRTGDRACWE